MDPAQNPFSKAMLTVTKSRNSPAVIALLMECCFQGTHDTHICIMCEFVPTVFWVSGPIFKVSQWPVQTPHSNMTGFYSKCNQGPVTAFKRQPLTNSRRVLTGHHSKSDKRGYLPVAPTHSSLGHHLDMSRTEAAGNKAKLGKLVTITTLGEPF